MRLLLCILCLFTAIPAAARADEVAIALDRRGDAAAFVVRGLPAGFLKGWKPDGGEAATLTVHVGEPLEGKPALLGDVTATKDALRFEPRFPLEPGLTYTAVFRSPQFDEPVSRQFTLPAAKPVEPTVITQVYPTATKLPENLLKFYLHFSAPVTQGDSYRHIRLLRADGDDAGEEVELPFLELPEELWSGDGTRLTVLFDPGRIKRGLKPREEAGPALEEGRRYTLVIDAAWEDVHGQPLKEPFRRTFTVTAPDDVQPDPKRWKITPPSAGTREALTVVFGEPLDHALASRVISVLRDDGGRVAGRVEIDRGETRWRFRPDQPWGAGEYRLSAQTILEDCAGNSIGRPFEVDIVRPTERRVPEEFITLPFRVAE